MILMLERVRLIQCLLLGVTKKMLLNGNHCPLTRQDLLDFPLGSLIVGAMRAGQETLVWTDTSLYSLSFIGPPYVFGTTLLNEGVGLISPKGSVNTAKGIFWMDRKGFYNYAGNVVPVPL